MTLRVPLLITRAGMLSPYFRNSKGFHELSRHAIENKRQTALIHVHEELARPTVHFAVDENHLVCRIKVPFVIRNFLIGPTQLAGIGLECNDTSRVQIYSSWIVFRSNHPAPVIKVRSCVSGTPINKIQLGIV